MQVHLPGSGYLFDTLSIVLAQLHVQHGRILSVRFRGTIG